MLDSRWVARLFEQNWPDGEDEQRRSVRVHRCDLLTTRYWPGVSCVCTYLLSAKRADQGDFSTIGVVKTTTEGSHLRLFWPDLRLPFLDAALDDQAMLDRLVALPAVIESLGLPEGLTITPVRYWPGSRCTLRYDLHAPAGSLTCYGKVLATVGPWLVPALDALYEHSQSHPRMLRIPRVLAHWPELHMLIQLGMPGEPLWEKVLAPATTPSRCSEWLRACGAGLAALQECQGLQAPVCTLSDEVARLYKAVPPLAALRPAWAERALATLETLHERAAAQAEPPPVASHGAFRVSKMLLAEDSLALLDFDSLCLANAASDVASFLAHLEQMAFRHRQWPISLAEAKRTFLSSYREGGGCADEGWLALYQSAELLRLAPYSARDLTMRRSPQAIEQFLCRSAALLQASG
jgi:hypothetical protein